jgi:putative tryptophan/tyrosine transport system substrate-binding protein
MKRREFIAGLLVAANLRQARAQQPAKVHRIAYVTLAIPISDMTETSSFPYVRAFFHELRRFGYIEGRNLTVERYSVERPTVQLAREVLHTKPDVIFSIGQWTRILKPLTTIPIVALMGDPVGFGLVASLDHPGGNITGATIDAGPEVEGKRLELLKEAFPQASRVGVLTTRFLGPGMSPHGERRQEAAQRLGLLLLAPRLEGTLQETEYRRFFEVMAQEHADSLFVGLEVESWGHRRLIVELAEKKRLPTIYPYRDYVEAGGLIAYSNNFVEQWTRAAECIAQILNGASPGDIPIYQAAKFELVINVKAANAIGLTIPPSLLARADEVIE